MQAEKEGEGGRGRKEGSVEKKKTRERSVVDVQWKKERRVNERKTL